jgi:hypothetical protein
MLLWCICEWVLLYVFLLFFLILASATETAFSSIGII